MHKFVRKLLTEWRKLGLPFEGETFIVAVSGGADSVALALALADLSSRKKLRLRFVIAHFNHDLRGAESDSDAEYVRELAGKLQYEFEIGTGGVAEKGNLEQNARLARYEFLTETARKHQAAGILTAHTVNDQAETFLLNLIRGSGIDGLSAMKPVNANFRFQISDFKTRIPVDEAGITLVRPLLNWASRAETEEFCRANGIEFRDDAMNEDLKFSRVRVRKILLPLLAEFNPKIVETLARTANLMQTENEEAEPFCSQTLILKDLKTLSRPRLYKTLRVWLEVWRGSLRQIDATHIEAIERLISSRKSGRLVELPGGDAVVKKDGKLILRRKNIENNER